MTQTEQDTESHRDTARSTDVRPPASPALPLHICISRAGPALPPAPVAPKHALTTSCGLQPQVTHFFPGGTLTPCFSLGPGPRGPMPSPPCRRLKCRDSLVLYLSGCPGAARRVRSPPGSSSPFSALLRYTPGAASSGTELTNRESHRAQTSESRTRAAPPPDDQAVIFRGAAAAQRDVVL